MNYYELNELFLEDEADPRFGRLSSGEKEKAKDRYRIIGGDKGDILFNGYNIENGKTYLIDPMLQSGFDDLTDDEIIDYAQEILQCSFESIGFECLY